MSPEAIESMITQWDTKSYHNRYFEMFAVMNEGETVGQLSLYEHSDSVISIARYDSYRIQAEGMDEQVVGIEPVL